MHRMAALIVVALLTVSAGHSSPPAADWAINATAIEACSCPHFCMCYFNPHPAAHHENGKTEHFCKFNNAYKVNQGHYGSTDLTGAKFWLSGDLGGDFSQGQMDWVVATFDKKTSAEQRQALGELITKYIFPVKWNSLQTAEGDIDTWTFDKDQAHATLNGGKTAEVRLKRFQGMTDEPAVLKNVKYWGTPRNDGFVMMPNELETYKGPNGYEFKGTNGFMLTFDMTSKDVPAAKGSSMSY